MSVHSDEIYLVKDRPRSLSRERNFNIYALNGSSPPPFVKMSNEKLNRIPLRKSSFHELRLNLPNKK
jgi:hypothetical protein